MLDPSEYNIGVPAEDIRQYCAGGYHPVHLHDHLKDGRYEVLNKLGFGAFSTVWLAKDHLTQRHVSIKIVVANGLETQSHELRMLRHVQASDLHSHPSRSCVPQILDSFFHDGPNGRHLCVVLELLGPSLSWITKKSRIYRIKADLARRVAARIVEAVAYLHSCGVAHGDIHMGNILLPLPPRPGTGSLRASASTQIGKVSKKDGSPLEKGVPEYLVEPLEYDISELDLEGGDVRLVDFGSAFFTSSTPTMIYTPFSLYPPELVFKRPLTPAVDIWNLGCTLYELTLGRTPFEVAFDPPELIPQHKQVLGSVPVEWVREALANGVLDGKPNENPTDDFLPLEEQIQRDYFDGYQSETLQLTREDLERLGRYLRKMLVVDARQRATAAELAGDTSWTLGV
ncbi:kinase-like domain-containing protein [Chaetomium fimeti]|uniref:non-specific serine/threonine protein kinase n=1 Tax=Chaetomium fimeti TaxID=1854472 RepID=A0AAE0HNL1_9PEZI|nr:kinase-like domain-containing protein [Chaetomium fimeti]